LFGQDITNPQGSTDQSGQPDVQFGFTGQGANEFQNVTSKLAHRGDLVSGLGQVLKPALRRRTRHAAGHVPFIDFKQNPDGIPVPTARTSRAGSPPTPQSARPAAEARRAAIKLKLISESQVSATLGKQALHQGLIAGLVGLLVVAVFLLLYYRVLA